MDLHKIRCFIAVVNEGTLSKAAVALNMTQPPLSVLIQKLEHELGVQLFVRRNRRLMLTDEGKLLYERANELLALATSISTEVKEHSEGIRGTVIVGCTSAASMFVLPKVVRRIQVAGMKILVHAREGETAYVLNEMRQRRIDICIVRTAYQAEDLMTRTLLREPLLLAVPKTHDLAKKSSARIGQLRDEQFFLHTATAGAGIANMVMKQCQMAGFSPQVLYRGSETLPMLRMVAQGLGVMFVPASYQRLSIPDMPHYVHIADANLTAELSVVTYENGVFSAAAQRVLELIEAAIRDMQVELDASC